VEVDDSSDGTKLKVCSGTLTVGNELNKLASNIAIGRNAAGIHYKSDMTQGILLGEQVAIDLLKEQAQTFNEKFSFTFTSFTGKKIIFKK
jgi:hypothetical protein